MTPEEEVSRGSRAKRILEDGIFKEAVSKVQQDVFDTFAKTDPTNAEELKVQRLRLKCLADIVRNLSEVMSTGRLAEIQIDRDRTLIEKIKERAAKGLRRVF